MEFELPDMLPTANHLRAIRPRPNMPEEELAALFLGEAVHRLSALRDAHDDIHAGQFSCRCIFCVAADSLSWTMGIVGNLFEGELIRPLLADDAESFRNEVEPILASLLAKQQRANAELDCGADEPLVVADGAA